MIQVVPGKLENLRFALPALCHIFDDDDGTAVRNGIARHFELAYASAYAALAL
ncbi:hypothetical protein VOI32_38075 [Paraburkholderia caribensis]|uniref:Uncharacterized protein n=1 Tax=Paraburkholderia caribensis TaxID=75105 RepID=A0ABV0E8F8_9BURK|nr:MULTISPECIES: hypothetical protein [Paraburkholderia]MCO4882474.1 hypothetical protein [Paraburkholderia caribensis]